MQVEQLLRVLVLQLSQASELEPSLLTSLVMVEVFLLLPQMLELSLVLEQALVQEASFLQGSAFQTLVWERLL